IGPILVWSPRRGQPLLAVGPTSVWSPRKGVTSAGRGQRAPLHALERRPAGAAAVLRCQRRGSEQAAQLRLVGPAERTDHGLDRRTALPRAGEPTWRGDVTHAAPCA